MNELFRQFLALTGLAEALFWHHALVFARVGAAVAMLPAFGEQVIPVRVRLGVALALSVVVASALPQRVAFTLPALLLETVAGLSLGFMLRLLVHGLQMAGAMAAQASSLSQMLNGLGPDHQTAISNLLTLAGLALFVLSGGLSATVLYLIASYDVMPMAAAPSAEGVTGALVPQMARAFAMAFVLSAPFLLIALLYNLALGAINRAMPALMVVFIGAPALTLAGLVILTLLAPSMLRTWLGFLTGSLRLPFGG